MENGYAWRTGTLPGNKVYSVFRHYQKVDDEGVQEWTHRWGAQLTHGCEQRHTRNPVS